MHNHDTTADPSATHAASRPTDTTAADRGAAELRTAACTPLARVVTAINDQVPVCLRKAWALYLTALRKVAEGAPPAVQQAQAAVCRAHLAHVRQLLAMAGVGAPDDGQGMDMPDDDLDALLADASAALAALPPEDDDARAGVDEQNGNE